MHRNPGRKGRPVGRVASMLAGTGEVVRLAWFVSGAFRPGLPLNA